MKLKEKINAVVALVLAGLIGFSATGLMPVSAEETKDTPDSDKVTITFDTNGGEPLASKEYSKDKSFYDQGGLPTPTNKDDSLLFEDWYTSKDATEAVDDGKKPTEDMTIYAKWVNKNDYKDTYVTSNTPTVTLKNVGDDVDKNEVHTFKITPITAGAPLTTKDTITIKGDGSDDFGWQSYYFIKSKRYFYKIYEVKGDNKNCDYDSNVYIYSLRITVNEDGTHSSGSSVVNDETGKYVDGAFLTGIEFTNTYKKAETPTPTTKPTEQPSQPTYKPDVPRDNTFEYTMLFRQYLIGDKPDKATTFKYLVVNKTDGTSQTVSIDSSEMIDVKNENYIHGVESGLVGYANINLNLDEVDGKKYEIDVTQIPGNEEGYTYDDRINHITFEINKGDDWTDYEGKVHPSWYIINRKVTVEQNTNSDRNSVHTDTAGISFEFINTYKKPVPKFKDLIILDKKLTGDKPSENTTFKFNIKNDLDPTLNKSETIESKDVLDNGGEKRILAFIDFPAVEGDYRFEITEVNDKKAGYTYDNSVYNILYHAVNDNDGNLKVTRTISKDGKVISTTELYRDYSKRDKPVSVEMFENSEGLTVSFTNNYTEKNVLTVKTPTVQKKITGDKPDRKSNFTFEIKALTKDAPMPAKRSIVINGEGTNSFGEITFTKAGKYVYQISEKNDKVAGYTYDTKTYQIEYVVKEVNGKIMFSSQPKSDMTLVFTNSYVKAMVVENAPTADSGNADKVLVGICALSIGAILVWIARRKKETA